MRTPTAERAPRRELWRSSAGPASRTGGIREKTNVPTAARIAAPTTAATGSTMARMATSSGPPTQIISCSAASRAYAVLAPSSPATVGQIERSADETGGSVRPARGRGGRDRGQRRVDLAEHGDEPEEGRVEDHAPPKHEPRAAAIDLAAPVRRPDRDRDPVRGCDEPGLARSRAATAHEQDERERRHPERQPRDDAPDEQRRGVVVREELAVARDAAHLLGAADALRTAGRPPRAAAPAGRGSAAGDARASRARRPGSSRRRGSRRARRSRPASSAPISTATSTINGDSCTVRP